MHSTPDEPPKEAGNVSRFAFAIVLTWPELQNAEFEVVQRICRAATNIGALAWVVDNDGFPLWSNSNSNAVAIPKRRLTRDDCTFVLSLHFESPRLYDIPTYTALWNPPDFFISFGYGRTISQLASHTDALSCRSEIADAHAVNIAIGLGREPLQPFPPFFHGVPRPYLEPRQDETSRLFYVGINWERVTGEKGRHHDLLKQLDAEDLISIYGPEQLFGVAPWRGFSTYRGSIPFDGESVVARINEAGICLALSSKAHQDTGIMSNRLFEALAAGAVIIANPHSFIDRFFSDVVYVVDDQKPVAEMVAEIRELVHRIRSNPAEARSRAMLGQHRLASGFALENNLDNLFAVHEGRHAHFVQEMVGSSRHEVGVILDVTGVDVATADRMLTNVASQVEVTIDLIILGAPDLLSSIQSTTGPTIRSIQHIAIEVQVLDDGKTPRRSARSGPAFAQALDLIAAPFFCTVQADDEFLSEHLASLAYRLDRTPQSSFACSGKLTERRDKSGVARRRLESLTFDHFEALAEAAHPRDVGRFLFRSTLIQKLPRPVFSLLDTLEHRLLKLWAFMDGAPAQTHYASYVQPLDITAELPAAFFVESQQHEVIRDTVRGRQDWLGLVSTLRQLRPSAAGSTQPFALTLGRTYATCKGGDGLPILTEGFSVAEETGTWIEGREGVLAFEVDDFEKPERAEVVLSCLGRAAHENGAFQHCSVVINGQAAGRIVVGAQPAQFRIMVPATVDLHSRISVTLRLRHADQVLDESGNLLDDRRLGLHVMAFAMAGLPDHSVPILAFDRLYALKQGGDGIAFLAEGFSSPQADLVWVYGPVAALAFTPEASGEALDLVLVGMGRHSSGGTASRICTITLDGALIGAMTMPENLERKTIRLPALHGGRRYRLILDTRQAGSAGVPTDPGSVSIGLQYFGLFRPATHSRLRSKLSAVRQIAGSLPGGFLRRSM